jgi:peptide deformylase
MSIIKDPRKEYIYLINPELISSENEFIFESEGCLSFPNRFWKTKRYSGYMIKNHVIDGDKLREETQYYYCDPENVKTNKMTISDLRGFVANMKWIIL